jgi:hypothetical protein
VNGTASKWIVSGSLQIGGFSFGQTGVEAGDLEGDNVQYSSAAGRGTLYVQAGGLVNVVNALDADPNDPRLLLAVGRFGRIQLDGGLINVGSVPNVNGNDTEARNNSVQLINDGVISGTGRIITGGFNNRYFGEVRVSGGQKLVIDSAADVDPGNTGSPVLTNFGVIQALGNGDLAAEIEFDRAPSVALQPIQPFQNLRVERPTGAPIGDFFGGLISAQSGILRFRSGIQNSGMMAFTAGQNYVTGNVVNMPGPVAMPLDTGIINISGPFTKVTFENDLINLGVLNISGGATIDVLARHSFVTTGTLRMTINPENTNQILSAGDAGIAGKLSINLAGFGPGDLHIGDTFPILSVGGFLGGVNFSDPLYPKVDLTAAPNFSQIAFPNLAAFGLAPNAAFVPIYTSNAVLVQIVLQAAAMGPDFNGDGVVNGLDLNIWLANVGITSGASVTQGDADNDGDVDGDDFLFWQRNVGRPMPWTGSGSGLGDGAAVPEPTGLALLVLGALLSITARRSR